MSRIGFDVAPWRNIPFRDFTDQELLEYWYKLRQSCNVSTIAPTDFANRSMSDFYVVDLQDELLRRLSEKKDYTNKLAELRDITWDMDIPSPTCPEYVEHHACIQRILAFIDKALSKEDN